MDVAAFEEAISDEYGIVHDRVEDTVARKGLIQLRDEHVAMFRRVRELESRVVVQLHEVEP